ncbi:MAG: hypothetical protein ACI9ES_003102, partial [Oceanospirillaceae bacterium]
MIAEQLRSVECNREIEQSTLSKISNVEDISNKLREISNYTQKTSATASENV